MNHPPALGIFGGTFDPVHWGHLRPVREAGEKLALTQIYLLPNREPVHKPDASANTKQRIQMLQLVCQHDPLFTIDMREVNRQQKSYSLLTLQELATTYPGQRIYFFIGMDSLNSLSEWYCYEQLFDYCHFVVTRRPGFEFDPVTTQPFLSRIIENPQCAPQQEAGNILIFDTNQLDISSTDIRQRVKSGAEIKSLLPAAVAEYIHQQKLYQ
ncbi:nicotinate-nucleotide adenylyltransferase [Thalassotalea litorea]|uniref:Probable nicotinate-nucleotide adenylyltransferase n=1 Tax=Thalassotalea litorea TaxID=2020715 RepID=A0A5R9IR08_9GAMM|nr:nicotinate-nucleotide adenylyltransferase [Thalassotalea litorea]TLU67712.1 nicotinate-nucleotide adenylyltransferase [Thalassotalea litorea]